MSKIINDTDTVNLIKAGCNQTLNLIQPEITNLNTDISNLDDNITLYTSETGYKAYFDIRRTGKLYQVKVPKYSYNTTTACIKTLDNEGLPIPINNEYWQDIYINNIELFKWYRCNYIRNNNGTPIIQTVEGCEAFATTGDVDVGTFGMSFYWSYIDGADSNYSSLNLDSHYYYLTISDMPNTTWNLQLWIGCQDENGDDMGYWLYSTYNSGMVNNKLRSQPNLTPYTVNEISTVREEYQKKGNGYQGAPIDRTTMGYIFYLIKYANKNINDTFTGYYGSTSITTGETDMPTKQDGGTSIINTPYRIQGIEYGLGMGTVASNVMINQETNNLRKFYVAPRGTDWTITLTIDMLNPEDNPHIDYTNFVLQSTTSNIFNTYISDVFITQDGVIVPIASSNSNDRGTGGYTNEFNLATNDKTYCYIAGYNYNNKINLCNLHSYNYAYFYSDILTAD